MPLLPNAIKQAIEDVTAELRRRYEPPVTAFPAGPQPLTIHDIAGPENRARGIYPQGARDAIGPIQRLAAQGVVPQGYHEAPPPPLRPLSLLPRRIDFGDRPLDVLLHEWGALGTSPIQLPQESPQNPTGLAPEPGAGRYLANLGAAPTELLSSAIGEVPSPLSLTAGKRELFGLPYYYAGLELGKPKPIKEHNAVTQFVAQSLPYLLAPEAGTAAFLASLPATTRDEVQAYQRGEISGRQLAGSLALTLGPLIAPELAKLGIKGAKAAGEYARSPEGRATVNNVLTKIRESSPETGVFKFPKGSKIDAKIADARDAVKALSETSRSRNVPPEARASAKSDLAVAQERIGLLKQLKTLSKTESEGLSFTESFDAAAKATLDDMAQQLRDELQRRNIPFGGRAGYRGNQAKRALRQNPRRFSTAFPGEATATLNARLQAVQELQAEFAPLRGQMDVGAGTGTQPQMEAPPQTPGGEVPLAERPALSLESPTAKGGSLFDQQPPVGPEGNVPAGAANTIPGLTPAESIEFRTIANRDVRLSDAEYARYVELNNKIKAASPPPTPRAASAETPPLSAQERAGEPPRGGEPPVGSDGPRTIEEATRNLAAAQKTGDADAIASAQGLLDQLRANREAAPTIPEITGRSKPLTPEERARRPRETSRAFFTPATTEEVTANAIKSDMDIYQRIQNVIQKIPGVKSIGTYIEPVGAARAQAKAGNPIPLAMVKRDLTVGREGSRARAGLLSWAGGPEGKVLGIDPNGIARAVKVKPGAKVPKQVAQRLDDIIEHPENYDLTPAQEDALVPIRHTLDASTQHFQAAGGDVHEVGGPYFPRTITSTPKGVKGAPASGIGNRLTSKPGFAKLRVFPDTRSAVAAGYEVGNPLQALGDRLIAGVEAAANKEAYKSIIDLGVKPSSRIPEGTTQRLITAREAYKAARKSGDARAIDLAASELDAAKRAMRKAGLRAATPAMGEAKAYGRIFPEAVTKELSKYGDVSGAGVVDEFFAMQRASETTGDHSSLLVQSGNLLYRNTVAWLKGAAYSTISAAREPWGWVSKNMDAINAAVEDGAAVPPSEFLLRHSITSGEWGPKATRPITRAAMAPVRAAQRMFEWNVFMGQVEWHKAAVRMGMSPTERQELGAVVRKAMGSTSMPGLTSRMRSVDRKLWYAGGFMRATLGLMVDASRGGVRGAEARKTLGMVIGGATALTIGLQYAIDGTLPNLTDPNRTDKRWGYVEFPGGGVNLYGPLWPYIRLVGRAGQDLQHGDIGAPSDLTGGVPNSATGEVGSLISGKFSLPIRTAIDLRRGETFTGEKIAPGWKGTLEYLARQSEPLGLRQASEGGLQQFKAFPQQGLETIGGRTTPNSPYQVAHRALVAAGVEGGLESGDLNAIADARQNNPDVAKALDAYQFTDYVLRQRAKEALKKAGMPDPDVSMRGPEWRRYFADHGFSVVPGADKAQTLDELRAAYVAYAAPLVAQRDNISLEEAKDKASTYFGELPPIKAFAAQEKQARLAFWKAHPDLLDGIVRNGLITPTKTEREIIDAYRGR